MSFTSRFKQAVKDYGTTAKVQCKMAAKIVQGAGVDELNKAAEDFEPIFNNSQRLKDVQKVGAAVGTAFWTGVICAIVD